jgi:hypothetical protein
MWFHTLILDIFRPFLASHQEGIYLRLQTFSALESSPDTAFAASISQLKNIVILYRSQHLAATYSIIWQQALLSLANAMLSPASKSDPEWRKYFYICIYGYEKLRHRFHVVDAIAKGLLTMAMRKERITSTEAHDLMELFGGTSTCETIIPGGQNETIRAPFTGDFELEMKNSDAASVETLAHQFDTVALFQEFTTDSGEQ